jgi:hypothetical protein
MPHPVLPTIQVRALQRNTSTSPHLQTPKPKVQILRSLPTRRADDIAGLASLDGFGPVARRPFRHEARLEYDSISISTLSLHLCT